MKYAQMLEISAVAGDENCKVSKECKASKKHPKWCKVYFLIGDAEPNDAHDWAEHSTEQHRRGQNHLVS